MRPTLPCSAHCLPHCPVAPQAQERANRKQLQQANSKKEVLQQVRLLVDTALMSSSSGGSGGAGGGGGGGSLGVNLLGELDLAGSLLHACALAASPCHAALAMQVSSSTWQPAGVSRPSVCTDCIPRRFRCQGSYMCLLAPPFRCSPPGRPQWPHRSREAHQLRRCSPGHCPLQGAALAAAPPGGGGGGGRRRLAAAAAASRGAVWPCLMAALPRGVLLCTLCAMLRCGPTRAHPLLRQTIGN